MPAGSDGVAEGNRSKAAVAIGSSRLTAASIMKPTDQVTRSCSRYVNRKTPATSVPTTSKMRRTVAPPAPASRASSASPASTRAAAPKISPRSDAGQGSE